MADLFEEGLDAVAAQRKQIIAAYMAIHKCAPDEIKQVHQMTHEGMVWFIRPKRDRKRGCEWSVGRPGYFKTSCGKWVTVRPIPEKCFHCQKEILAVSAVSDEMGGVHADKGER